jgi:succinyl-CoA synthetase beta subunit
MNSQPSAGDALKGLYNSSQDKDVKHEIVNLLAGQRNAQVLVELGRSEKDLEQKKYIVERVMGMNTPEAKQFLEEILK